MIFCWRTVSFTVIFMQALKHIGINALNPKEIQYTFLFIYNSFFFYFVCRKYVNETKFTEYWPLSFFVTPQTLLSMFSLYLQHLWIDLIYDVFMWTRLLVLLSTLIYFIVTTSLRISGLLLQWMHQYRDKTCRYYW